MRFALTRGPVPLRLENGLDHAPADRPAWSYVKLARPLSSTSVPAAIRAVLVTQRALTREQFSRRNAGQRRGLGLTGR